MDKVVLLQPVPAGIGSIFVGMDGRPSPTDLRLRRWLSGKACPKGHVCLRGYLQQHVGDRACYFPLQFEKMCKADVFATKAEEIFTILFHTRKPTVV